MGLDGVKLNGRVTSMMPTPLVLLKGDNFCSGITISKSVLNACHRDVVNTVFLVFGRFQSATRLVH